MGIESAQQIANKIMQLISDKVQELVPDLKIEDGMGRKRPFNWAIRGEQFFELEDTVTQMVGSHARTLASNMASMVDTVTEDFISRQLDECRERYEWHQELERIICQSCSQEIVKGHIYKGKFNICDRCGDSGALYLLLKGKKKKRRRRKK